MTRRLLNDVISHCFTKSHAEYERETGVPASTVSDIAIEQSKKLDASRTIELPKQLGVDEFFVLGRANGIFTDIGRKQSMIVLRVEVKSALRQYSEKW